MYYGNIIYEMNRPIKNAFKQNFSHFSFESFIHHLALMKPIKIFCKIDDIQSFFSTHFSTLILNTKNETTARTRTVYKKLRKI